MHQVGKVCLDLRLGNINNLEAILNEQLVASDGLGTHVLLAVVGGNFAHNHGNSRFVGQTNQQAYDFWRVGLRRVGVGGERLWVSVDNRLNEETTVGGLGVCSRRSWESQLLLQCSVWEIWRVSGSSLLRKTAIGLGCLCRRFVWGVLAAVLPLFRRSAFGLPRVKLWLLRWLLHSPYIFNSDS